MIDKGYYRRLITNRQAIATARQFGLKLKQKKHDLNYTYSLYKIGFKLTPKIDLHDFIQKLIK